MVFDDLSFDVNIDGKVYKCDILEVVPNDSNSNEPYVIFTNYDLDENDDFVRSYGKLVQEDDRYSIDTDLSQSEINYIEKTREDDIVKYVNSTIEGVLNE